MQRTLDAGVVHRWCRIGLQRLGQNRAEIDALNVYPVPDSDTGTNLCLTMQSVVDALDAAQPARSAGEEPGLAATLRVVAHAALLGARGNSGVIVSQLLRGVAETLTDDRADGPALARALTRAADLGYRAVGTPVEGTVLTVARAAATAASTAAEESSVESAAEVATRAAAGAREALARTPAMLDVLRQAGVVDAGGRGLVVLLEALASVLTDTETTDADVADADAVVTDVDVADAVVTDARPAGHDSAHLTDAAPAYEVMYLLDADDDAVDVLRSQLAGLGDSLVVVGGDGLWNVHVHVDDAGAAVEAGMAAGRPYRVRVTHLADAAHTPAASRRRVVGLVSVSGVASLLEAAGAMVLVTGPGSTPDADNVLATIRAACAPEVVVLSEDAGMRAVAEAAATRARAAGVRVAVLPTRACVQALAALAVHDPARDFDDDVVQMTAAAGSTRFGEVVPATSDAVTTAGICHPGDVLGLIDGDVAVIGATVPETGLAMLGRMLSGGGELVTLVLGAGAEPGLADRLVGFLHDTRPEVDVVVYEGDRQAAQPLLVGVE